MQLSMMGLTRVVTAVILIDLLDRGRAALLLRHLGDVLDGGLVIGRGHHGTLAVKLFERLKRLDDGQRTGIAHGIDFNLR